MNPTLQGESWDALARAAALPDDGSDAIPERDLLCFEVAEQRYALPIDSVREIVRLGPVTPIPRVSDHVRGVISLRGAMIQLIDFRRRLGLPEAENGPRARVLVVKSSEGRVAGLLVDSVSQVMRVAEDAIGEPPAGDGSGLVSGLCVRGEDFVSVLHLEKALDFDGC